MKRQRNIARCLFGLIIALAGLMSVAGLAFEPVVLAHPPQADLSWSNTGSLNRARYFHTATLLPSGNVLVAGGYSSISGSSISILNNAELYHPDTGIWSVTANLTKTRVFHTATLLPNGKVLVVGGSTTSTSPGECCRTTNSAELYHPDSGTWSITGNLNTSRDFHTATLLPNGKVLVAGGWKEFYPLSSAELYDPDSGTWSITGSLKAQRFSQTATLLQNGKVLVAGGSDDGDLFTTLASAELYDPDTGTWSNTPSLSKPRIFHTATLLQSGKVLVAGSYGGYVYGQDDSVELYDPSTAVWSRTGNLNTSRNSHTVTLMLNGKVLVAGGSDGRVLNSAELYDPESGNWYRTENLNTARWGHTATLLQNGRVLVAGGSNASGALNSAELYDPAKATIVLPRIISISIAGKKLFLFGENFGPGAVILLNGEEQITKYDVDNPQTTLIGKKAGKKIKPGDKLQVRNPNGAISEEFTFTGL